MQLRLIVHPLQNMGDLTDGFYSFTTLGKQQPPGAEAVWGTAWGNLNPNGKHLKALMTAQGAREEAKAGRKGKQRFFRFCGAGAVGIRKQGAVQHRSIMAARCSTR